MSKPPLPLGLGPPLPPSTPEIPPPPPSKPPPESQVEDMDMDLSDEEETEIVPIETSGSVTTSRKPSQDLNLSDALSSFYSDLGLMAEGDSASQDGATISQEATPNATPPKVDSPGPSSVVFENSPNVSDNERSDSPFDAGENVNERRKRKVKDCILMITSKVEVLPVGGHTLITLAHKGQQI